MSNKKYFEVGWIRLYIYIGVSVVALISGALAMSTHTKSQEKHMSQKEVRAITEMGKDIQYNRLELIRVDGAWKADLKELKNDMNERFDRIENLIRNGH